MHVDGYNVLDVNCLGLNLNTESLHVPRIAGGRSVFKYLTPEGELVL